MERVSKHPYCREYTKLFKCAERKGLIKHILSAPLSQGGTAHPTNVRLISPGYTGPNIPKPKHFCRELAKDARTAVFLGILRKHSGCAPRPKGSSSRFLGAQKKFIIKKTKNREQVCIKTKPRMCKYLEDGSLGACSKEMVCAESEVQYRIGNIAIKEKVLIYVGVFALVAGLIWHYNKIAK